MSWEIKVEEAAAKRLRESGKLMEFVHCFYMSFVFGAENYKETEMNWGGGIKEDIQ